MDEQLSCRDDSRRCEEIVDGPVEGDMLAQLSPPRKTLLLPSPPYGARFRVWPREARLCF